MTERLYYTDPYLTRVRRDGRSTPTAHEGRPRGASSIAPRSIRPPAASRSTPARFGDVTGARRRRRARTARSCTSSIAPAVDGDAVHGAGRLDAPLRSHAAAHRPARAVGGVRPPARARGPRASTSAPTSSTIDLGARGVAPRTIARAEDEANRVVWEDRPVDDPVRRRGGGGALPLRKESKREGTLRLIDVEDFDLSACGGTHVARTGAIGIIAVASCRAVPGRHAGRVRLRRPRAGGLHRALRDAVAGSVRALSVLPAELPAAIERLQAEGKDYAAPVEGPAGAARRPRGRRAGGCGPSRSVTCVRGRGARRAGTRAG